MWLHVFEGGMCGYMFWRGACSLEEWRVNVLERACDHRSGGGGGGFRRRGQLRSKVKLWGTVNQLLNAHVKYQTTKHNYKSFHKNKYAVTDADCM